MEIYTLKETGGMLDYVKAMWLMLQAKKPKDYVIASGYQYNVKEFVNLTANKLNMKIIWKGKGLKEKAYFNNKPIIEISKKYFRPAEVDSLKGYARQAISELKWKPKHDIHSLIEDMIVSFKK